MIDLEEAQRLLDSEIKQMYGVNAEAPDLNPVSDLEEGEYLKEGYAPGTFVDDTLVFNEELLESDQFRQHISEWTDRVGEQTLEKAFNEKVEDIAESLDVDPGGPFEARFAYVDGIASFSWVEDVMRHGFDGRTDVNPGDSSYTVEPATARTTRHEAAHAVQAANSEFKGLMALALMKTETQDEFSGHPDIASIEALPRFEEDPEGKFNNSMVASRTGEKWNLPHTMSYGNTVSGDSRINGGAGHELGDHLYSGPYAMAEMIAYTVKNHFERQDHVDDPVEETEKALYELVADAEDWERMMEGIWNDWDVPNYHDLFRENYVRIRNEPSYAKSELNRLESELEDLEEKEDDLELYYQSKAFVHAYRESGRTESPALERLERYADTQARETTEFGSLLDELDDIQSEKLDINKKKAS